MTSAFRVEGADDFHRLADRLQAGKRTVHEAVTKGFEDAGEPLLERMRRGGVEVAPRRGGMAARIARVRGAVDRAGSAAAMRVQLVLRSLDGDDLSRVDEGTLRHPVFGRRPWMTQGIPAQGFSRPLARSTRELQDTLRRRLAAALDDIGG